MRFGLLLLVASDAFVVPTRRSSSHLCSYGRGAEIWPPANEKDTFKLADSFPGGKIPTSDISTTPPIRGSRWFPLLASVLLIPLLRPIDALIAVCLTGYFLMVSIRAKQLDECGRPFLAALPPQGHVPRLLEEPLGKRRSDLFTRWMLAGVGVALLPVLCGAKYAARPLAFLFLQLWMGRAKQQSLPLKVWFHLVVSITRLGYYLAWFAQQQQRPFLSSWAMRINLLYLAVHLLMVWPFVALQFVRAHVFAVEAEQVTTRSPEDIGIFV